MAQRANDRNRTSLPQSTATAADERWTAIYVRVSSKQQDIGSQLPDLERWADRHDGPVRFYIDVASGVNMDRPQWNELACDLRAKRAERLVVWRLDRLGRTASGLTALLEQLEQQGVEFISLREGIDLSTPAGRLMANVLASVASYETEVRGERVRAGQARARAEGKTWGGSQRGRRIRTTDERRRTVLAMAERGEPVAVIARVVDLSRTTVYKILDDEQEEVLSERPNRECTATNEERGEQDADDEGAL